MRILPSALLFAALMSASLATPAAAPATDPRRIDAPPTNDVASMALSADGRQLALVSRHRGRNHLWVKSLATGEARPLANTEEAVFPFWSPDGREIGFFARNEMRAIEVASGHIRTIVTGLGWPAGGSWSDDGTIISVALQWPDGNSVVAGEPQRLFTAPMFSGPEDRNFAQQYAISSDGQRLIVIEANEAYSPVYLR